jgi:hypothetical protein
MVAVVMLGGAVAEDCLLVDADSAMALEHFTSTPSPRFVEKITMGT